ncbi:MAG TPA: PAS domain S-box protein, partial [Spirochaetota bacterium]|nr:PAS domain S-box protein [Spirochaetota bacterium]
MAKKELHGRLEQIVKKHIGDTTMLPDPFQSLLQEINDDYLNRSPFQHDPAYKAPGNDSAPGETGYRHDLLFFIDKNDIITGYSGLKDDLFLEPESFLRKKFSELPLGDITSLFVEAIKKTRETGSLNRLLYSGSTRQGRQYYEAQIIPSSDNGIIIIISNETHAILQNDAIRNSEKQFRGLAERSFDMVFLLDRNGIFTYASPSSERISGHPARSLVHNHFFSYLPPNEFNHANRMITRVLEGKNIEGFQASFRKADGRYISIEINASPIREDTTITGIQGIARDISEHLDIQHTLKKSEERFRSLIEYGTDVISIVDLDGTIRYESPSVERVLGFRQETTIGKNAFNFIHPDDIPIAEQGL